MHKKIFSLVTKNIKTILKFIWGIILLGAGIRYIYFNYTRILVSSTAIDKIIIAGTLILVLFPFFSEISLLGFSMKKEIHKTKQEMDKAIVDLKYQMIDIKSTTTQNATQNLTVGYLPSKDEMMDLLKTINETKVEDVSEQKNIEIQNEFDVSDDAIYLFKVRTQLEKYITKIGGKIGYKNPKSYTSSIDILKKESLITPITYENLRQIFNICNRGIHGEIVSEEYLDYVKKISPKIYYQLSQVIEQLDYKHITTCPKCKYTGYSKFENVCPKCGFVSDD